jgi:predicted dehydrogenase
MSNNLESIVVVGAGKMAQAYTKVLLALKKPFTIVGRSEERISHFQKEFPTVDAVHGGIDNFLAKNKAPQIAIVAANITVMADIAISLIKAGTRRILLEKPGSLSESKLMELKRLADISGADVYIGFNRRSYASVLKAQEIIKEDGGVTSFHFEFTEMVHKIKRSKHGDEALSKWVISNSSHVIDTAFHLGGKPKSINSQISGNAVEWHPSGSIFTGSGLTKEETPFTYHANWGSAGRWNIEISTSERKLFLSPMEQLKVQKRGEMEVLDLNLDYQLDEGFKPGIYLQVKWFFGEFKNSNLLSLKEQIARIKLYNQIGDYNKPYVR